jgi:hypothetical protein
MLTSVTFLIELSYCALICEEMAGVLFFSDMIVEMLVF